MFNNKNPKYNNVYFIFIDSLSREQFFKTLPYFPLSIALLLILSNL